VQISVFGLGYVGTVSAACLARQGNKVIGVDSNSTKVDMINRGMSPIVENEVGSMIEEAVRAQSLHATRDAADAVMGSEISIICVGTPSARNGSLDLSHVRTVCEQIGAALRNKKSHLVVARSTMLPGSMRSVVIPALEQASGKKAGVDFGICINPEFLREGTAVYDYHHPPKTVIGEEGNPSYGDLLVKLYEDMDAPMIRTGYEAAELVKYADNAWHALKVTFANEIGNIAKAVGTDGHEVMEHFCRDTKLNISPYYLKPGFAFGGSCLPKDVRALVHKAQSCDLELPLLNAILPSNKRQVEKGIRMITDKESRKVGVLGFSFKAGTDDLRESPMVDVIEHLLGKGYELKLYDKNVKIAALMGANQDYIVNRISHISRLMANSIEEVLDFAGTVVIGNNAPEFAAVEHQLRRGQVVVDLVRALPRDARYDGICW
jgi:GDP-mannose 6-dehydrogenase